MILELDIGNSSIKWRVLDAGGAVTLQGREVDLRALKHQLDVCGYPLRDCRISAVKSALSRKGELVRSLQPYISGKLCVAESTASLAGVLNGYIAPGELGTDRWLALVAGYQLAGTSCVVVDAGTAITVDYIRHGGCHLGGMIAPGLGQMQAMLSTSTGLRQGEAVGLLGPQVSTAACLSAGIGTMLSGFLNGVCKAADEVFDQEPVYLVTGGDASIVGSLVPNCFVVDDLVFRGLALACPL